MKTITVGIADGQTQFREGLLALFEKENGIQVLFDAKDEKEIVSKTRQYLPEILLMDLDLQGFNGDETFNALLSSFPNIKIMVLTSHCPDRIIVSLVKKGVSAVVHKTAPFKTLLNAIEQTSKNGFYYDEKTVGIMARTISRSEDDGEPCSQLNLQEIQILRLMCLGYSTTQIAEMIHRSPRTVEYNRNSIWHKTKIESKSVHDLTVFALRRNLISVR